MYSEPCQQPKMDRRSAKIFHFRCLTGFWVLLLLSLFSIPPFKLFHIFRIVILYILILISPILLEKKCIKNEDHFQPNISSLLFPKSLILLMLNSLHTIFNVGDNLKMVHVHRKRQPYIKTKKKKKVLLSSIHFLLLLFTSSSVSLFSLFWMSIQLCIIHLHQFLTDLFAQWVPFQFVSLVCA